MFQELKSCHLHFLLDGFPRTLAQAHALHDVLKSYDAPLDLVLNLKVPEKAIIARMLDRYIHPPSGRVYSLSYNPPKNRGKDDETGEPLMQRSDDNAASIHERLRQYYATTAPLVQYYADQGLIHHLHGTSSFEIYPKIAELIRKKQRLIEGIGRVKPTI